MTEEEYKAVLTSRLSEFRLRHSLEVAKSARQLAERYGADSDKAYLAGLLHDITKESSPAEQLLLFSEGGICMTELEKANHKLWHAMSAAVFVQKNFGLCDDDFVKAIRYHTTGRAEMSLLEKVIYIADFISADRDYNGVDDMRRLSGESLEAAMLYALEFCISDLARRGGIIHPDSVSCYNELLIQKINLKETEA